MLDGSFGEGVVEVEEIGVVVVVHLGRFVICSSYYYIGEMPPLKRKEDPTTKHLKVLLSSWRKDSTLIK